jgi:bidirectional [NiFe] hydrogenase diaphorase subunit
MELPELYDLAQQERQDRLPVEVRCCVAAGCVSARSEAVLTRLEQAVADAGLGKQVKVCGVGCLRLCSQGPLVQVAPEGTLYQKVTPENAPSILAAAKKGSGSFL